LSTHSTVEGTVIDATQTPDTSTTEADAKRAALVEAARKRAAALMGERRFTEAKKALEEADSLAAGPSEAEVKTAERFAQAEAARAKAARLIAEQKFTEARKALEEADALEAEAPAWKAGAQRVFTTLRSRLPKLGAATPKAAAAAPETSDASSPVEQSMDIVNLYSKIAAVAGIVPGGLLNFAAILAVQVTMVWRITKVFGHEENRDRIRGSVLSLIGSAIPTSIGHGAGLAVASIPLALAGAVVYFVATPVLAYALTHAVGNAYIMHFESGGTLLTFDPKAFADYFIKEYRNAGGTVASLTASEAAS
jgi:uncharacterized protein (DUF697 family)